MNHTICALSLLLALAPVGPIRGSAGEVAQDASAASELKGILGDPNVFPLAVWLQDPRQASRYKEAGINLYVGLWRGPTEEQLRTLTAAGMPVICQQNKVALAHKNDPIIVGWMHGDEPDNAQEVVDRATGKRRYGPPIPPARIVAGYRALQAADAARPIMLNLGQGVANDQWKGRGPGAGLDDYPHYVEGADIVSFDVYPVAGLDRPDGGDLLWYVAKGIDRLVKWTGGKKRIWNCIECTHISNPDAKATPDQVKAEVWMSLIHGSRGLIYFVHEFRPRFNEHALLDDRAMLAAVTAINRQIQDLAPVINGTDVTKAVSVRSARSDVPIDLMSRRRGKTTYIFAVGMRNGATNGTFEVRGLPDVASALVLGEGRRIKVEHGRFDDDFKPFGVHLYEIRAD
jgi:hypothetical protein